MSKLQKKPSALKRGHPTLQNMNFQKFFYFCGSFSPSWIQINWPDWIRIQSGSGSATLMVGGKSGSLLKGKQPTAEWMNLRSFPSSNRAVYLYPRVHFFNMSICSYNWWPLSKANEDQPPHDNNGGSLHLSQFWVENSEIWFGRIQVPPPQRQGCAGQIRPWGQLSSQGVPPCHPWPGDQPTCSVLCHKPLKDEWNVMIYLLSALLVCLN